jgi:hypothetical protein
MGFDPKMAGHESDGVTEKINPELTDGAYIPSLRAIYRHAARLRLWRIDGRVDHRLSRTVVDKMIDAHGLHLVQVECKMVNQIATTLATAKAEVEPPVN